MKKALVLCFSILLIGALAGCGKKEEAVEETQQEEVAEGAIQNLEKEELDALFAEYDLTMVNIWATWCGPCVGEMPEISALHKELPENINMITVCTDSFEALATAQEILEQCNSEFITLHLNADVEEYLMQGVFAYPTTLFVNRDGEFVGEPVIGANSADQYLAEINARLE